MLRCSAQPLDARRGLQTAMRYYPEPAGCQGSKSGDFDQRVETSTSGINFWPSLPTTLPPNPGSVGSKKHSKHNRIYLANLANMRPLRGRFNSDSGIFLLQTWDCLKCRREKTFQAISVPNFSTSQYANTPMRHLSTIHHSPLTEVVSTRKTSERSNICRKGAGNVQRPRRGRMFNVSYKSPNRTNQPCPKPFG
jgi:hypothetical protein